MTASDLSVPPGVPAVGRRERRKRETRAALERAALRLFAEKGYEQTTVEEIADEADVAVRTFFRYFASKQHVLFGDVGHQRIGELRAALAASPADLPPLEAVRTVLDALDLDRDEQEQILVRLRLMDRQPSLVGVYLMLNHELRQILVEFVADRTGLAPTDPYPLLVGGAAVTAWDAALSAWSAGGGTTSLAALRRELFAALTAGVLAGPPDRPPDGPG
ncbi:TetR family transcriptional regulator [Plantactinospora sp. GCM10030261]|uniref:acyl-CoA-like ligand-binding transcription factor n=1 Tax=Plantactinospora sp. GCM10030261 TaxID=3273420 RepID=UPI00361977C3